MSPLRQRFPRAVAVGEPAAIFLVLCVAFLAIASWRSPGGLATAVEHIRGAAGDYLVTAEVGLPRGTWRVATFPGFAIAIRAAHEIGLGRDLAASAVLVGLIGGVGTSLVMWSWTTTMALPLQARRIALAALLLSPAGFTLLVTPQSEAIFLPLAIGACLAVERNRPVVAAILLIGASATRLSAALFAVCAVVTALERSGALRLSPGERHAHGRRPALHWDRTRFKVAHLVPLLGLLGMAGFFAYTWVWHGSPFAFFVHQESLINVGPRWHPATWTHWGLVTTLPDALGRPGYLFETTVNVVALAVVAWCTPGVVRRFGLGYGLLVAGHVLIIWFMAYDFASASRYLLGAFPVFALAGLAVSDGRRPAVALVAASAIVCVVFGTMQPNGVALA